MADRKSERIKEAQKAALRIICKGTVQGVGFRPFIYNYAQKVGVKGWVLNSNHGVEIHAEGPEKSIKELVETIRKDPPRLAKIDYLYTEKAECQNYTGFEIRHSSSENETDVLVPPDTAVCKDCKKEVFDPYDRHYLYPFTNCTNCGPRFTIVKDFPYDRLNTTMNKFIMCDSCYAEYTDPADRRFHAQSVACPECGPEAWLIDSSGTEAGKDWKRNTIQCLKDGAIVAVKGIGGFHLACDALNFKAVERLRKKKSRPYKPLAVMARDIEVVKKYCCLDECEEEIICSPEAPIVILDKVSSCALPSNLSPNIGSLGVMLPYSPLHLLLFDSELELIVMTSGNPAGLPLEKTNKEALKKLNDTADFFLLHNREIENGTDDSVVKVKKGQLHYLRRSRGYIPKYVDMPVDPEYPKAVLGIGGEMKNAFCILKPSGEAYTSQHMGEIETLEAVKNLRESLNKFKLFLEVDPDIIAYDLHPQYNTRKIAEELEGAKFGVQHHHAHMAACMADNGLDEPAIGVIMDGTGFGLDGNIWGCEFLSGGYTDFVREAHLQYIPLIGGERAVNNPWLVTLAYLKKYFGDKGVEMARERFKRDKEITTASKMLENDFNCPRASSAGRLFDAVSAYLGVCEKAAYEGQPAVELGEYAAAGISSSYGCMNHNTEAPAVIDPENIIRGIIYDREKGSSVEEISTKFHNSLIQTIQVVVDYISGKNGIKNIVLSGGVFHNDYLLDNVKRSLEKEGYCVFAHNNVPTNDGGICLGQAAVAYWRWRKNVSFGSSESD